MRKVTTAEKYSEILSQEIFQELKNKFEQADYLLIFEYTDLYNLEDKYLDSNIEIKLVNINTGKILGTAYIGNNNIELSGIFKLDATYENLIEKNYFERLIQEIKKNYQNTFVVKIKTETSYTDNFYTLKEKIYFDEYFEPAIEKQEILNSEITETDKILDIIETYKRK